MRIVVIGGNGYVGSRLVPELAQRGHCVRSVDRWGNGLVDEHPDVSPEVDVLDVDSLKAALEGADVAFYLIHSIDGDSFDFEARERVGARNLAQAAEGAGIRQIVFLGGLADEPFSESAHLRSRHEVGALLRAGATPVTELRTPIIIGPGSPSYVMLRQLAERLPLMVMPRWVSTKTQPIALADVVRYLALASESPPGYDVVYDIGGPEVMTYREMLRRFARQMGRRPLMIEVPVLTPRLSSYWVDLVTDVPAALAAPLIEGLRFEAVVHDRRAEQHFGPPTVGFDDAVRKASDESAEEVAGWWAHLGQMLRRRFLPEVVVDERVRRLPTTPDVAWSVAVAVGGRRGYPALDWLWRIRGIMDRAVGGPGLNRGGPSAETLSMGERLDFWEVVEFEPGRRLRMKALMKVPGEAELEMSVLRTSEGSSAFVQTARFRPRGWFGRLYWWALYPVHWWIFRGMASHVVRRCAGSSGDDIPPRRPAEPQFIAPEAEETPQAERNPTST